MKHGLHTSKHRTLSQRSTKTRSRDFRASSGLSIEMRDGVRSAGGYASAKSAMRQVGDERGAGLDQSPPLAAGLDQCGAELG